jgi:NAD(P)-dependent dehydrogenase (short-subunit alcohol dehydrogenase family)
MATIVITGANRGIGLELARQYAVEGHDVIRCMRGEDKADPPFGTVMTLDVTDGQSVAKFAAGLGDVPIDLLINNAGISGPALRSSTEMDYDGFQSVIEANVFGPLRVHRRCCPICARLRAPRWRSFPAGWDRLPRRNRAMSPIAHPRRR